MNGSTLKIRALATVGAVLAGTVIAGQVEAQYPERPVTLVVPYSAGGGADRDARLFAPYLEQELGAEIRIVNMPGAGGSEGTRFVYEAEPDGYTIGYGTFGNFLGSFIVEGDVGYDPREFSAAVQLTRTPLVVVANPDTNWTTIDDMVSEIHENPGEVAYAAIGGTSGTAAFPLTEMTQKMDLDWNMVPYSGSAEAIRAILSGEVETGITTLNAALGLVESGELNLLAVIPERVSAVDAPSLTEAGYDIVFGFWRAAYAPPGLPEDIEESLVSAWEGVVGNPDLVAEIEAQGGSVAFQPPEEFRAQIGREIEQLGPVAEQLR